jgi:hypothetical protein
MPEKPVKRRLQDCDAALASDDGPIFSTVAKLVEALKRSIPEDTQNLRCSPAMAAGVSGRLMVSRRGNSDCFWRGGPN